MNTEMRWCCKCNKYVPWQDYPACHEEKNMKPRETTMKSWEDRLGNRWEPPNEKGRIRVCDLHGNLVDWYDPGESCYNALIESWPQ